MRGQELTIATADGSALIADVAVALKENGTTVRSLTLRTPTLDDVFLALTGRSLREEGQSRTETAEDTETQEDAA